MEGLLTLVSGFGPWNWFFLVVALFVLDTILPGVHFLWFRLAAVGVGVLTSYLGNYLRSRTTVAANRSVRSI
jgi:membrane protein implicated in regulation of membrane protease activity